jgi:hypothetical protein
MAKDRDRVPTWQDNFKSSCLAVGFRLGLTRAMCEFLSAVSDDVHWDRSIYGSSQAFPDNFLATSRALVKRGLIQQKPADELDAGKHRPARDGYELWSWQTWELTPAGAAVVTLLKLTGLYVEADMAVEKKARKVG